MQCRSSCEMNLDTLKKKRTADEAFEEYEYVYGIVTTATDWFEVLITKLKQDQAEIDARILKLEQDQAEREAKKNRKFQTRCIQIAKEILNEEPIIEYRPPFLNGLELDAFFQKYRIALEVQGAQHRLHSTSWYKDVKKLEDIVNRDRKKRCICQDKGISLLEVWYDEKPEIVIPKRIQKIKEFVCLIGMPN
ncbi:unnamed protein product [Rhizophagus irregularis]|nr:unnamed protein product [Rhizophagus irregularis]